MGGSGSSETGGGAIWMLPRSLLFQLCALSYVKVITVHWLADQWVTLCRDWYCLREISPTDPIPVMHKKNDRSNIFVLVSLSFILFDQS